MTKSGLIASLREQNPLLPPGDVSTVVNELLAFMGRSLTAGHRIEIRGFGSFALGYRPARRARNPRSGAPVHVPGKFVPQFRAGKELRERVDLPRSAPEAASRPPATARQARQPDRSPNQLSPSK